MRLRDSPDSYGWVSRLLHWTMATLFLWQFAGMILRYILGRTPLMAFWVGSHPSIGALLLTLAVARAVWALVQHRRRPRYSADFAGRCAQIGHLALYGLMLVIPSLGLLRLFGDSRAIKLFGIAVRGPTDERIAWMMAPANLLHGALAWLLLALVLGHVAMALIHHYRWRDSTLGRMIGRPRPIG